MEMVTEYWARPWTLTDLQKFIDNARNHWFDDKSTLSFDMTGICIQRRDGSESYQEELPFDEMPVSKVRQASDYDWPTIDRRKRRERTIDDAWEDWRDGIAYR